MSLISWIEGKEELGVDLEEIEVERHGTWVCSKETQEIRKWKGQRVVQKEQKRETGNMV